MIGDTRHLDAVRQTVLNRLQAGGDRLTKVQHIAGGRHRYRKANGGLSVNAKGGGRRLGGFTADGRQFAEWNKAIANVQRHRAQAVDGGERAANTQRQVLTVGAQRARRHHRVLRLDGRFYLLQIETHARQPTRRKGDDNLLFLHACQRDFADVGHRHQIAPHGFYPIAQLARRKAFGGEAINRAVGVVKLVVNLRSLYAFRQRRGDILHFFPHLIPDALHLRRRRVIAQIDKNDHFAGVRLTFDIIEIGHFLQFFLQRIGHQLGGVMHIGARPAGADHGGFDGKRRIFVARQLLIAQHPGGHDQQHKKHHQLLMRQRPCRQVK